VFAKDHPIKFLGPRELMAKFAAKKAAQPPNPPA
jgi:hypothetical protein